MIDDVNKSCGALCIWLAAQREQLIITFSKGYARWAAIVGGKKCSFNINRNLLCITIECVLCYIWGDVVCKSKVTTLNIISYVRRN